MVTDCHTSDIGQWFAMPPSIAVHRKNDTEQCPIVLQLHTSLCTHRPRQLAAKEMTLDCHAL